VLQSLEGEFYCLARTKLSKHNVVFSDIWLLLVLLVRKVSYSCVFFITGLQNFATCSDLFFLCWYRMLVLLQGVMHIKMMQVCSCLFKVCSELATTWELVAESYWKFIWVSFKVKLRNICVPVLFAIREAAEQHRITESLRLEKTSKIPKSNHHPTPTMPTDHIPHCHISMVLEHLQTVTPPPPWAAVPLHHHSFGEEIAPKFQPEPLLGQLKAITSHPIAVTQEKRPTPTSPQPPFRALKRAIRFTPSLLFSRLNHPSSLSSSPHELWGKPFRMPCPSVALRFRQQKKLKRVVGKRSFICQHLSAS